MSKILLLIILTATASAFTISPWNKAIAPIQQDLGVQRRCFDLLPFVASNSTSYFFNMSDYYSWYCAKGNIIYKNKNPTLQPGHFYDRHIAVNNQCTVNQIKQKKTVFLNFQQFGKVLSQDTTSCQTHKSETYTFKNTPKQVGGILGLNCGAKNKTQIVVFNYYVVIYRRAVQSQSISRSKYLQSSDYTILTMYPTKSKSNQWVEEESTWESEQHNQFEGQEIILQLPQASPQTIAQQADPELLIE